MKEKSKYLYSLNPANNFKLLGKVRRSSGKDIEYIMQGLRQRKDEWRNLKYKIRHDYVNEISRLLLSNKNIIAESITNETGKPINESCAEVDRAVQYINYCLANINDIIHPSSTNCSPNIDRIYYEPKGTVLVILSWNFPVLLFVWWVVPNLLVGNVVAIKASEQVPLTNKILEKLSLEVLHEYKPIGFIFGKRKEVNKILKHHFDLLCFTGSSATGLKLNTKLAQRNIPVIMEMSGSNPTIICKDAIISDKVVELLYKSRFRNSGQSCTAMKRLIVHESKTQELLDKMTDLLNRKKIGCPMSADTDIGSLVNKKQLRILESQVQDAINNGANIICGGKKASDLYGAYYVPTIVSEVTESMRLWKEEVFGPVLPVVSYKNTDEAIVLANHTCYGLGAHVFTSNINKAKKIAKRLEVGMVDINFGRSSVPCNPFGGIKYSGLGRQHGEYGIRLLCNLKVVSIDKNSFQIP